MLRKAFRPESSNACFIFNTVKATRAKATVTSKRNKVSNHQHQIEAL